MNVAIIGSNQETSTTIMLDMAFDVGKYLMDHGHIIVNGGMGGTMEEVARGARSSAKWDPSKMIGIIPGSDRNKGNPHLGITIATGLGSLRNRLVVLNGDLIVCIGGGAGTLTELGFAWELGKPIAAFGETGGWALELAESQLDNRRDDRIVNLRSIADLDQWLTQL